MSTRFALRTAEGHEHVITGPFRIGRDPDCEICLNNELVSHIHASIWVDHGHLLLRDERSRNGTFVNGLRLKPGANQYLHDGDKVRVADLTLTVTAQPLPESPPKQVAASAPPRPTAPPAPVAPPLPAIGATRSAPYEPAPPPSRPTIPLVIAGGCVALALLCLCVLGAVGLTAANQPALATALAPFSRKAPTPGAGTTALATPGPAATGTASPSRPGNVSVQVLPTLPPATPLAPAAYAANSQAVAAALAELNQAQLRFIRDAATSHLTNGSLIDDLLSIAAVAFKLALGAEKMVQASAVQAGGSATAGQVAGLYAGLARYGYAQALDAQNLRLALANGTLDLPSAAARVANYGAWAWNPTVTGPPGAAPGNPFLPLTGNPAAIPGAAPLSPAGAKALQTSLGPQAGLQSWIAASAQTVTRTVDFPRPIRPLGNPQAPELLARLITAAGQADGDRASQADAAGLQRLGATLAGATGSRSSLKEAEAVGQTGAQPIKYVNTAALILTADQQPGGNALPAFTGGAGAALAKGAPAAGGDNAFINHVFSLDQDNTPTQTGEMPVTDDVPLVTIIITNFQVERVDKKSGSTSDADVSSTYDVIWTTNLASPHFPIYCNSQLITADGPSGTLHVHSHDAIIFYPGNLDIICFAGRINRQLGVSYLTVLVGDSAGATQRAGQAETAYAAPHQTGTAAAQITATEAAARATQSQAVAQTQGALETEQGATQTAEHIATVTQAAAGTATAQAAGIFTLNGTFNLVQPDVGCTFADAPSTSGTLQMNVNFNSGQVTASFAGGGGGTRSLTCNQDTGDMHWQQTYSVDFSGAVDRGSAALALTGTLTGNNNVSWSNCKHAGQDSTCPSSYAHGYSFPVTLSGTFDKTNHNASGAWQVQKISLPTSGDWSGG